MAKKGEKPASPLATIKWVVLGIFGLGLSIVVYKFVITGNLSGLNDDQRVGDAVRTRCLLHHHETGRDIHIQFKTALSTLPNVPQLFEITISLKL